MHIIAIVIETPCDKQENPKEAPKIQKVLNTVKAFNLDSFAKSLQWYYKEYKYNYNRIDEIVKLGDAIVERACLKKLINMNKKASYEELKR